VFDDTSNNVDEVLVHVFFLYLRQKVENYFANKNNSLLLQTKQLKLTYMNRTRKVTSIGGSAFYLDTGLRFFYEQE
jgi:hypothetical protein